MMMFCMSSQIRIRFAPNIYQFLPPTGKVNPRQKWKIVMPRINLQGGIGGWHHHCQHDFINPALYAFQRLVEISNEVLGIFQAQRQADEVVHHADGFAVFRRVVEK